MSLRTIAATLLAFATAAILPFAAGAQFATPWQKGMQAPATPVMQDITVFHDKLLWLCILISVFVLGLLVYVVVKFNEKANPRPTRRTHNTAIEVLWTVVPILILFWIAFPAGSFPLLYKSDVVPKADMTIKAIGHQWYWSYEYPDHGNFTFDAVMIEDKEELAKTENKLRLLETDNTVVVPVGATVRVIVTADDVIHSWAVPAFGVKTDAVPGRANETWFQALKTGTFYGQCSELCGVKHGFMPIKVKVVPKNEFDAWAVQARRKFARVGGSYKVRLAGLGTVKK